MPIRDSTFTISASMTSATVRCLAPLLQPTPLGARFRMCRTAESAEAQKRGAILSAVIEVNPQPQKIRRSFCGSAVSALLRLQTLGFFSGWHITVFGSPRSGIRAHHPSSHERLKVGCDVSVRQLGPALNIAHRQGSVFFDDAENPLLGFGAHRRLYITVHLTNQTMEIPTPTLSNLLTSIPVQEIDHATVAVIME
jgi:hypothetical protein